MRSTLLMNGLPMVRLMMVGLMMVGLLGATRAVAIDTEVAFDDPAMQARYENLIDEVRCVVCQNQTIKDSNAFLATDLRREIRRLMMEGKTDAEIADFLVARYGEFVLYRPRMSGSTLILWIAPLLLIGIGAIVVIRIVSGRGDLPLDDDVDQVAS